MIDPLLIQAGLQANHRSAGLHNPFPFIFLYGPPGSGKSAVAPRLAKLLGMPWLDLDGVIEHSEGRSIQEIFEDPGEGYFRELEKDILQKLLCGSPAVIALGGGALLDAGSRKAAEAHGNIVCLSTTLEVLENRLMQSTEGRPLLNNGAGSEPDLHGRLARLLDQRQEHYRSFPLQVDASLSSPGKIARLVQSRLGYFYLHNPNPLTGDGCPILIQEGGIAQLGVLMQALGLDGQVAVVVDSNVADIYGAMVLKALHEAGFEASLDSFPPGEAHKTPETVARLYQSFSGIGLERSSTVVALGGGITSDLAGFAASTYLRGIRWVAVPTSLLGMVDASIGGKTGYDLPQGKNLVGTFHPPALVLTDPQTLSTLPQRELIAGLAEVVKAGLIADPGLFRLCASGFERVMQNTQEMIRRCIAVKVRIVQADPYERDRRAALNLGHTLGHAVECASGYRLLHGEAVAIGLVLEARLSEQLGLAKPGLADTIAACLAGLGLPAEIPGSIAPEEIIQAAAMDKKSVARTLRFTLPIQPGRVRLGVAVEGWERYIQHGKISS